MTLDELAAYYATLPDRIRAEREAVEDAVAREVASGQYEIQQIADALNVERHTISRMNKAARARWAAAE